MRILCIKLKINQGCTTMHGRPIIKIHITKTIVGEDRNSGEKPGGGGQWRETNPSNPANRVLNIYTIY
jgi:hypothetical protein